MKYTTKEKKRYQRWGAGACAVAMVWLVVLAASLFVSPLTVV